MYFNIFSHLFVIYIITESHGLISFLSVYVCVWVVGWIMYVKRTKREGVFSKRKKAYKGEEGVKNRQIWAHVLFEWPVTVYQS